MSSIVVFHFISIQEDGCKIPGQALTQKYQTPPKLHHYVFIISQLWLTSHPRSTVVLLDTRTPGTSREIYSEDADGETRTRNPVVMNRVL